MSSATADGLVPSAIRSRLESLDVLRGIAALLVVTQHFWERYPAFMRFTEQRFRIGEFGVVLFFLTSGFVIPASLERRNSLREFWIGRFFRLFPLYWFVLGTTLLLYATGYYRYLNPHYVADWARATAVNLTMLQQFLGAPLAIGQSWTLAYEVTFYAGVSVLFVAGIHRRSARAALLALLASAAIGAHQHQHTLQLLYQPALYFGTMFVGSVIYRWTAGQVTRRTLAGIGIGATAAIVVGQLPGRASGARYSSANTAEILTYLTAFLVFLAVILARHRRFPRPLVYLGTISYSLYLNHSVLLYAGPTWPNNQRLTILVGMALTVVGSTVTYHLVERPAQALGRRLVRRLRARSAGRRERVDDGVAVGAAGQQQAQQHAGLVRVEQPGADQPALGQVGLRTGEAVGVP